jgi:hypothetical protein
MSPAAVRLLLDHARAVLIGKHGVPQAPRAAAVLGRQALEDAVNDIYRALGMDLRPATMRSRLVSLRVLAGHAVADLAAIAWHGLSHACHHHAYELTPTVGEVGYLIERVEELVEATASVGGNGS